MPPEQLKSVAVASLKWSMFAEAAAKLVAPVIFIVLARILVPEDFGVAAAATVVISFSQVFWDAGLSKTLVQRESDVEQSANVVLVMNIILGLAVACLLQFLAGPIAQFFDDDRIAPVVRVLSAQVVISAAGSAHAALLQREFRFRKLFWIRLLTTSAPAAASIPLAYQGAGYWALVAGTIVGQLAQTFALWHASDWRPRFVFMPRRAIELWGFGRWVMLSAFVAWLYGWLDVIIVGRYLGTSDMGLYQAGNTLVVALFGVAFSPLLPVLYATFSRSQDDLERIRNGLLFVIRSVAVFGMPVAFGLMAFRLAVGDVVFGSEWSGIAQVVGILAISHGFSWLAGMNGEYYRAVGRPHLESVTGLLVLGLYLAGYLVAVQFGLQAFLVGRLCLAMAALCVHVFVLTRSAGIPVASWLRSIGLPALLAGGLWGLVEWFGLVRDLSPVYLAGFACALALVYFGAIWAGYPRYMSELWRLAASSFQR